MSSLVRRIKVCERVVSSLPWVNTAVEPGEYDAILNKNGAVSIEIEPGRLFGLKPHEFTWLEGRPRGWGTETMEGIQGAIAD